MTMPFDVRPATPKQVGFASKLTMERGIPLQSERLGSASSASRYIDELMAMPRPASAAVAVSEPGMYRGESGRIYKVQRSASGGLYAKQLTPIGGQRLTETDAVVQWEFQYDAGAVRTLSAAQRLSLEDAKAFGIRYGICCVCGARLKDAKSVAAGIGPICSTKL